MGGAFTLPSEVNVVYESGIDQATKDRLASVLSVKNVTVRESNALAAGGVNIAVGIAGSDGAADAYADAHLTYANDLFNKVDAYLLAIEANQITILGKDTDAAFYAMASLKMILEQSAGNTIRGLQMEDYAIGQYRGFIEGYYGIPWSVEDRISLMNFGGDFKMNAYIFAPKDDPYHNTQWRELYPEDKLEDIRRMVAAGTASKCRFVWAIHPFMNQAITLSNYDEVLPTVKAKFQQLYDAGVRQFVISADDASSNVSLQVKLLNDMNTWVKAKGDCYNLVFVPMVYCTAAASWYGTTATAYYNSMKAVNSEVEFMWTGESVCYPATQATFNNFKRYSDREPFMWLNWPVNDVNHARLVMGPAENCILNTGGVTGFKGIVTNPLEQAEASKTSLFAIADYAWNTADFDCQQSWADSFQYIDAGAPEALHEMCKHMTNPQPGGITQMSESTEIAPYVTAFQTAYQAGEDVTAAGNALVAEFEKILAAANAFDANGTNENLKEEMQPWTDALRETSKAAIGYIKAAMAVQKGDTVTAVNQYLAGEIAQQTSKNCAAPQLNGTIMAQAGAKVLMPFTEFMHTDMKADMEELMKGSFGGSTAGGESPTTGVSVIHSGLGGIYQNYSVDKIIDGDDSTYGWFNENQTAGAYIGLDLGDTYRINTVRIRQGNSDTHGDIFANAILEYSTDGENYTVLETIANTNNIDRNFEEQSVVGRYIRIRTATAASKWYAIRDFSVTTSAPSYDALSNVEALQEIRVSIEENKAEVQTGENGTDVTLGAGDYIGIRLPAIREVTSITADYTANENLVLETSLDGSEWEPAVTGAQETEMCMVRIRNKGTGSVTLKLNELSLLNSDSDARFACNVEWEEGHDPKYATDSSLITSFRAKDKNQAGSLTWRIADPVQIGCVYVLTHPDDETDAKVLVQTNTNAWVEKGTLSAGMNVFKNMESYEFVKAVKIQWETKAPEIMEMYTTEPRQLGMTLNKTSAQVQIGNTLTLTAEAVVGDGEDETVTWSSSKPNVARVDENGVVTGVAAGNAVITASAVNGKYTATCTVSVVDRGDPEKLTVSAAAAGSEETEQGNASEGAASLAIDGNNNTIWHSLWDGDQMENLWFTLDLGEIKDVSQMTYLPRQGNSENGIITSYELYVSQDGEEWTKAAIGTWPKDRTEKIAQIVTPVPARYVKLVTIDAYSDQDGNHFASAAEIGAKGYAHDSRYTDKRYVIDAYLTDVIESTRYTEESYQAYTDARAQLEPIMNDAEATQEAIDAVAAAYRAAVEGLKVKVTGVTVTPATAELAVGETTELTVTIAPDDAGDKTVTFASDKPEVASVNAEGVVEAKSAGTAVITVTADGGLTATCAVTVLEEAPVISVTGISVTGVPEKALEIGDTVTVIAVVEPENAANKNVTWVSSKPEVASVADGVITALAAGETQITVTTEDGNFTQSFDVKVNEKANPDPGPGPVNPDQGPVKPEPGPGPVKPDPEPTPIIKPELPKIGELCTIAGEDYEVLTASEQGGTVAYKGYKGNKKKKVKVPATVTINGKQYKVVSIAKKALYKKTKLKKAVIGVNVETIGASAFAGCKSLKKVTVGKNVVQIGKRAFSGDKKLRKIVVKSAKLKKVGAKALAKTKNVTIKAPRKQKKAYRKLFKKKGTKSYKVK